MHGWWSNKKSTLDWQEHFAFHQDPPECLQLSSVPELISSTLPDTTDGTTITTPPFIHLSRILSSTHTPAAAASYAAALRENITAETGPLLANGTCQRTDLCAQLFRIPKVALMFLSKGELPHEDVWGQWLASAEGRLPYAWASDSVCVANNSIVADALLDSMRQVCAPDAQGGSSVILRQHLFSVYVHAPPSFAGFRNTSIFANHLLADRTVVWCGGGEHMSWWWCNCTLCMINFSNTHIHKTHIHKTHIHKTHIQNTSKNTPPQKHTSPKTHTPKTTHTDTLGFL